MNRQFVQHLPDLISPEEYESDPEGRQVRIRIRVTQTGVELLGDAVCPKTLEKLLEELGPGVLEQMLCG